MPDGTLLDADDAVLVASVPSPAPAPGDQSLARVLVAVPDAPVSDAVIETVLARIALDDELSVDLDPRAQDGRPAGGQRAACVALDGGFALGPLRGRHRVDAARYIGVAARAGNRARRLAELARAIAVIDERDRTLAGECSGLERGLERLHDEVHRFPDESSAVRAHAQLDRARSEEQRAAALTAAEQQTMAARGGERDKLARASVRARARAQPAGPRR